MAKGFFQKLNDYKAEKPKSKEAKQTVKTEKGAKKK